MCRLDGGEGGGQVCAQGSGIDGGVGNYAIADGDYGDYVVVLRAEGCVGVDVEFR